MKKKNVILLAGILSVAVLGGCGEKTSQEDSTSVMQEETIEEKEEIEETEETEEKEEKEEKEETKTAKESTVKSEEDTIKDNTSKEVQQETEETTAGVQTDLSAVMTEIYKVSAGSASADAVAENFKNYALTNGAPSSSGAFESMATEWFQTMQNSEGKDIRAEFSKAFNTVTATAQGKDETLEYDVAYTNVVSGILAAIGEVQEETTTSEDNEFTTIMTEIYKVSAGSASADTVAENFKNYAFNNGAPSSSSAFESKATEWFQTMQNSEGKDIRAEFSKAFNTVTATAQGKDETLEYDVAYLNVVNGIFAAIGQ